MYEKIKEIASAGTAVQLTFIGANCIVAMKPEGEEVMGNPVIVKNHTEESVSRAVADYAAIAAKPAGGSETETVGLENVAKEGTKKSSSKAKTTAKTTAKKEDPKPAETKAEPPVDPTKLKGPDPDRIKLPSEERRELFRDSQAAEPAAKAAPEPEPEPEPVSAPDPEPEAQEENDELFDDF